MIFLGYYPSAVENYNLLSELDITAVKGNHDVLVTRSEGPENQLVYWEAVQNKAVSLSTKCPQAIKWLNSLQCKNQITIGENVFEMFHETPDDASNGRYYPDNATVFSWFLSRNKVLLLGHTPYPLYKQFPSGRIIINPGSVGQPMDGILFLSWCVIDTETLSIDLEENRV